MALVVFDSLILGQANRSQIGRSGIYRYSSQLLISMTRLIGKHKIPLAIKPFCSDFLYAKLAEKEILEMERIHGVCLNDGIRNSKSWADNLSPSRFPKMSPIIKDFARPLVHKIFNSSFTLHKTKLKLLKILNDRDIHGVIYHTPFQAVSATARDLKLPNVIATVHDVLPKKHPEFFTRQSVRSFESLLNLLMPSDHIICVSESTRRDFLHVCSTIPEHQIHVIPLAAASSFRPENNHLSDSLFRKELGLKSSDLVVLSLCTLEPRKNLTTLIKAFELTLKQSQYSSIKLVLAGSMGWKNSSLIEQIRSSPAKSSIIMAGRVPDRLLPSLYSLADVFVYVSLYEGFGLPPLEAMQCGTPVIASNTSSLPEVAGNAAILVDPLSIAEIANALEHLLSSSQNRKLFKERGLLQAAHFSWDKTAQLTANLYQSILNG